MEILHCWKINQTFLAPENPKGGNRKKSHHKGTKEERHVFSFVLFVPLW
jgi:hypothetical protein